MYGSQIADVEVLRCDLGAGIAHRAVPSKAFIIQRTEDDRHHVVILSDGVTRACENCASRSAAGECTVRESVVFHRDGHGADLQTRVKGVVRTPAGDRVLSLAAGNRRNNIRRHCILRIRQSRLHTLYRRSRIDVFNALLVCRTKCRPVLISVVGAIISVKLRF